MAEHTPVPTPHRAVYGFALFLFFKTLFVLYLFWAFVPDHIIEETLGLTYLPDKYFALYIPILVLCSLTIFGFFIYPSWNLSMQNNIDSIHTITDCYSINRCQFIDVTSNKKCDRKVTNEFEKSGNRWKQEQFCDEHLNDQAIDGQQCGVRNIENYCDCTNKIKCLLNRNPNHINVLYGRDMVPNVCDINIVDVCSRLFRERKYR